MIVLPIESSEEDDTPQEWSLLELNGELLPAKKEAKGDHMELGSIKFDAKGTSATITIASHELKGKVEILKQPFVVMRPCKRPLLDIACEEDPDTLMEGEDGETAQKMANKKMRSSYEVAGVVRSKVLFDQYPKSIMR